jgi:hypothetical protein
MNAIRRLLEEQFQERVAYDGDTAPDVSGIGLLILTNTSGTTITDFTNGRDKQVLRLLFTDGNTTITDGAEIRLAGAGNFTGTADDTMTLIYRAVDEYWYEVARSVN